MADTPYVTADELQERIEALAGSDTDDLEDLVSEFEGVAEDFCGVALTTRTGATETHTLDRDRWLFTTWPEIQEVTSITVSLYGDDTELDSSVWRVQAERGAIDLGACYTGEATVVYSHGAALSPRDLKKRDRACRIYVRACALRDDSNVGRDVLTQAFEGGGTTRYSTPNKAEGRPTGYLDVDRLLCQLPRRRIPGVG